ncbi:hypothetical protein BDK51DRAFT_29888 [Blyttiomyces helicus]|uniref:Uncharacterized protein n=1 Tax=Blyttiomyces helicus TaxID=388810 RepID=A0A4P9W8X4_9FUNG|nr:hypothetical protein BDK51DRAFT_29888 [Blyttiomyces helicus]|eukprot:RKO88989.1 hypothetical protein BDK51DRAFT_29888 [Blyttiomyces helicus]
MADLSLTNGSNHVSMQCDANGNLSVESSPITNVGSPVGASDALTVQYVEGLLQGLSVIFSVYAASGCANVDLTQLVTVADDLTVMPGNRILVKDQSDPVQNGIYLVECAAPPSRLTDLAVGSSVAAKYVFVNNGVDNANTGWICSMISGQDVVGVKDIAFTQFSAAEEFNTRPGSAKNENTIQVLVDGSSIEIANKNPRVSSRIAGQGLTGGSGTPLSITSIDFLSSVGTLTFGMWNAGVIGTAWGGTGSSSFNVGRVIYSNGTLIVNNAISTSTLNIGNTYQSSTGSIQTKTSGPFSLDLFSKDNTGTCLNFYGGLGVASNFSSTFTTGTLWDH